MSSYVYNGIEAGVLPVLGDIEIRMGTAKMALKNKE